jgi:hypothetical protein
VGAEDFALKKYIFEMVNSMYDWRPSSKKYLNMKFSFNSIKKGSMGTIALSGSYY